MMRPDDGMNKSTRLNALTKQRSAIVAKMMCPDDGMNMSTRLNALTKQRNVIVAKMMANEI
ncbi:hypothetical protein PAJ34TS1_09330 [Paenibacillus azoreducens]|uniref:Uncharacterized protein n=1 Tax=Paenibacillus azoreducens TaxID=116718 RepID=A0A920CT55_9BACL|nr:hypothetical protein J34TS1_47700 [Paenibacillus azoreducens]